MTTSTLELVDWATILDDEPACEWPNGCDEPADSLFLLVCGCRILFCSPHTRHTLDYLNHEIQVAAAFYCPICKRCDWIAENVSDLLAVVSL